MISEAYSKEAAQRDAADPLAAFKNEFCFPKAGEANAVYLCGNSLGLMPRATRDAVITELDSWSQYAVEGHFEGPHPWMPYHEEVRKPLAALVGAQPDEVVAMNSLTVNLHLMMVSFYRPTPERFRIVMEKQAFPSDRYAVESQIRFHGFDPEDALIELEDEPGSATVSAATLEQYLAANGSSVALVLMPGVQYLSGEYQDLAAVCELGKKAGACVGLDLAHAVGNLPLRLHQWDPDFAVWCHYKYVNSGPGAVAGCFVSQRHTQLRDLPRFAGWWGHDKDTRFAMGPDFVPSASADGWQLSNPPVLALAPVRVSTELFAKAGGMDVLREKSRQLTGYLERGIKEHLDKAIRITTPDDPERRGCQLSLQLKGDRDAGHRYFRALSERGVICDWREPNVIRIAPTPLYNSFADVRQFVEISAAILHS